MPEAGTGFYDEDPEGMGSLKKNRNAKDEDQFSISPRPNPISHSLTH
jgi:hypothetical protein